jgi:23S rRNA pseudouridine2605 synthase
MKERIQKVLAGAGVASRRTIEDLVRQGRVSVNGKIMTDLPILVDPLRDKLAVDDETVRVKGRQAEERIYLVMNKPRGVYTTNVAQGVQTRAIDLLPPKFPRVYPVGRLDADSKGLLLLTNDGDLTNLLTHPRYGIAKTYRAVVDGYVTPAAIAALEKGIWLVDKKGKGFKAAPNHIRIASRSREKSVLEVVLREGRNVQVRRILAKLGHKVRDLTRTQMGPLTLRGLAAGQYRPLTHQELRELRKTAQYASERPARQAKRAGRNDEARMTNEESMFE